MENNFDTRRLITELLEFVGVLNKNYENISYNTAQKALKILDYLNSFLDILYGSKKINTDIIDSLILIRNELRKNKFYDLSDLIRKSLQDAGIYIEDNGDKTIWYAKD